MNLLAAIKRIQFRTKELNDFTEYLYHPLIGLFYRHRFEMVRGLLDNKYDNILEIGFGPGALLPTLAGRCSMLYGIDIHNDVDKVGLVMKECGVKNIQLFFGDIRNMPFKDKAFNLVVCQSVLEHIKDLELAVNEISRVLKKGSSAIIGFPIRNKLSKALFAILGYDDKEIHPSGHKEILTNAKKKLALERSILYPKIFGLDNALYFVGKFRNRV